jgi:uncharacterized damage-inducible protein DinB
MPKSTKKKEAALAVEAPLDTPKPRARTKPPIDYASSVRFAFATNERINQFLLERLDPGAWGAEAPVGKGRTIRAIVAHMHNVRHMWLVVSMKDAPAPDKIDRTQVTLGDARAALAKSGEAMLALFDRANAGGGHVKDFKPDVVGFLGYVIAHEAHHRGQICLLARMLGFPLPQNVGFGMWEWNKRGQELTPDE